jgi:hypothetical protein
MSNLTRKLKTFEQLEFGIQISISKKFVKINISDLMCFYKYFPHHERTLYNIKSENFTNIETILDNIYNIVLENFENVFKYRNQNHDYQVKQNERIINWLDNYSNIIKGDLYNGNM